MTMTCYVCTPAATLPGRSIADLDRHLATTHPPAAPADWMTAFRAVIRALPVGVEFTTADLHGKLPDPEHHSKWGSATSAVAEEGLIRPVAVQCSDLPTTRRSLVRRWVRVDAARSGVAAA